MKILQTQQERGGNKITCHLVSDVLLGSVLKGLTVCGCVQIGWLSSWYKVMAIEFPGELLKGWCNSSWLAGNLLNPLQEAHKSCQETSLCVLWVQSVQSPLQYCLL